MAVGTRSQVSAAVGANDGTVAGKERGIFAAESLLQCRLAHRH